MSFLLVILHFKNKRKYMKQSTNTISYAKKLQPSEKTPYIVLSKTMFNLEPGKYFIKELKNKQYILENGVKIKIKKAKHCKVVGITPSLNTDKINYKRRSKNVSKLFSNKWKNDVGKFLFSSKRTPTTYRQSEVCLYDQQIQKIKKIDHQEKCRRDKKEKRILDKQYIEFLEKQQEESKNIMTGYELWNLLILENLSEFTIPEFTIRQVDTTLTIKIYLIVQKYLKQYLTQKINVDRFFLDLRRINDKNVSNLAGKIFRLTKNKNENHLVYSAIDEINTYLKAYDVSRLTYYNDVMSDSINDTSNSYREQSINNKIIKCSETQEVFNEAYLKKYEIDREEMQRKIKKEAGKSHEIKIDEIISKLIPRNAYLTEEELSNANTEAGKKYQAKPYLRTPDYLFKNTCMINGAPVKWIDCKMCVIFNMLTSQEEIDDFKAQIDDYCRLFGPGLIIFHRPSFENTFDLYDKPEMVSHMMLQTS